ncbi:MAG TPA: T9SS type A sorting domain-containing protein [Puia sp.]
MMQFYTAKKVRYFISLLIWVSIFSFYQNTAIAQSCPVNATSYINAYPNTFYRAMQATVNAGSSSILLDSAIYGTTPISSGDILLVIQMQGAQINALNTSTYGDGSGSGSGYLNNSNLLAGNMEYVVASNSVPLIGGTVNLVSPLVNSYRSTPFGTDGQYTYQVVRVPIYYNVKLTGAIIAPRWNGAVGGMVVLYATDSILLNSQSIDASGLGFRGGGGRVFVGAGSGSNTDYITASVINANGSKGEGIAGTPKYLNDNNAFLDVSATEGYPNGSYARGAPGNAGGGATDGNPSNNAENTGGGGGANGGAGGNGGNSWSSNLPYGGKPGALFAQASPSRLVMGGGGGAGTTNDGTGTPGGGFASSGAAGGGIIILMANVIGGTGTIKANGMTANSSVLNDGAGGGGAGGSILLFSKTGTLSTVTVSAKGGTGGSNEMAGGPLSPSHGPGGGGGGGVIYSNATLNVASSVIAGVAGTTSGRTINYGATGGAAGLLSQTITQPQAPKFPLNCVILPVSFLDVTAVQENSLVTVGWDVSNEVNTQEYLVEKSLDGIHFTTIGQIARNMSATNGTHYEYLDNSAFNPGAVGYYRIEEVDVSGQSMYSKIVSVRVGGIAGKLAVYPNPTKGSAKVSFVSPTQGAISLRLFDLKGCVVWQQQYQTTTGQNTIQLDNFRMIPDGMYILQWFDGLKPEQTKLVVNH